MKILQKISSIPKTVMLQMRRISDSSRILLQKITNSMMITKIMKRTSKLLKIL
jgi:hypothetical protein